MQKLNATQSMLLGEFKQQFPDERSAQVYLEVSRWGRGARCPYARCDFYQRWRAKRMGDSQYFQCNLCRQKFTVRTGTIMARSHIPLHKWLYAMFLMGMLGSSWTASLVSRELGITHKSASFILRRLYLACHSPSDAGLEERGNLLYSDDFPTQLSELIFLTDEIKIIRDKVLLV